MRSRFKIELEIQSSFFFFSIFVENHHVGISPKKGLIFISNNM